MPRPKGYVREEVLEVAMHLFWQRGFHDVSTRDLAQAMGINANSLYAEFGSKTGLFEAAVDQYEQFLVPSYIGRLEQPTASLETVRDVLRSFAGFATPGEFVPGCLITNAATEHAPDLETSSLRIGRYVERLSAAFSGAVRNDDPDGDPAAAVATGRFLAATTLGIFVMLRAQTGPAVIGDAVAGALAHLETRSTPAPPTNRRTTHELPCVYPWSFRPPCRRCWRGCFGGPGVGWGRS